MNFDYRNLVLSELIDSIPNGVLLLDTDDSILKCNQCFAELLGYSDPTEITGKKMENLIFESDNVRFSDMFKNDTVIDELFLISKNKTIIRVKIKTNPFDYNNKNYVWCHVFHKSPQNIKEGQLTLGSREKQISKFNSILAKLIKSSDLSSGNFDEFLKDFVYKVSEGTGVNRVSVWSLRKPNDHSFIKCICMYEKLTQNYSSGGELYEADFPVYFQSMLNDRTLKFDDVYADERVVEFTESYFPENQITSMLDAPFYFSGKIAGVVCLEHTGPKRIWEMQEEAFLISATDILSIAYEELARKELEVKLNNVEKIGALTKLSGSIAHDFNNILGVVTGYSDLLMSLIKDEKLKKYSAEIYKAAQKGMNLTNKLLSFARKKVFYPSPVDLESFFDSLLDDIYKVLPSSVQLKCNLGPQLWDVYADPEDLKEALSNVLNNSIEAIDVHGEISVKVDNCNVSSTEAKELSVDKGDYVKFVISDNGNGISPNVIENIFEPFSGNKGSHHLGLGLTFVYEFVKSSHGKIQVDSVLGSHTIITLLLPKFDPKIHSKEK